VRSTFAGLALLAASIGAGCSPGNGTVHVTVACHGVTDCATREYEQLTAQCSNTAVHDVAIKLYDTDPASPANGVEHTLTCPHR
jgi:hypothetical protein